MKPFDQSAYDADDSAKYVVLEWLHNNYPQINAHINPDDYGIDILSEMGGIEVEVRHAWSGPKWPFPNVRIPIRKRKFLTPSMKSWFMVVNNERTHALIVSGAALYDAPVRVIPVPKYDTRELFMITSPGLTIDLTQKGAKVTDTLGKDKAPT